MSVNIEFNSEIYDQETITQSITDFGKILTGKVSCEGKIIKVSLSNIKGNQEEIRNEFCNYILASMKNSGKA